MAGKRIALKKDLTGLNKHDIKFEFSLTSYSR
jgi:hypothetical protein